MLKNLFTKLKSEKTSTLKDEEPIEKTEFVSKYDFLYKKVIKQTKAFPWVQKFGFNWVRNSSTRARMSNLS
jgi:hypothetical protein